jgi:hypothetical protein
MIKLHPNIITGSPTDLNQLSGSIYYIINCSINLNNLIIHQNFINANITKFDFETLNILNNIYNFIKSKILLNQTVFLLCENGLGNSLIVGIFILMKMYNMNCMSVYYEITKFNIINSYDFYSGLKNYEPYIITSNNYNFFNTNKMDIS